MGSASLNAARRAAELDALAGGEVVDLLVVGGGISGAGVALDAVTRGLSVALIEKADLAHGTSRWSSKLVHGGLRYLAKGDVGIAHESAVERGILMASTAPHLVRALPMITPVGPGLRRRQAALAGAGVLLGDALRAAARTTRATLPGPRWLSASEVRDRAPCVTPEGLHGGLLAYDGQLVDDARLVLGIARTAASHGARIITYCEAKALHREGADVVDRRTDRALRIRARHVINATGVWASRLAPEVALSPSKGTHLVFDAARLDGLDVAVLANVPGTLSRFVFLLPQTDGRVYLGLTDEHTDEVEDVPTATDDEARFLLDVINRCLARPLGLDDVIGRFAGLRPLVKGEAGSSADLSRSHRVIEGADRVLTLIGGKLTTYRRMAEDAVDAVAARPGVDAGPCLTRSSPLVGAGPAAGDARDHLLQRYGGEAPALEAMIEDDPSLGERILDRLPYLRVELAWAVRHELAVEVGDLLDRRTRIGLVPADRARALDVARATLLGA